MQHQFNLKSIQHEIHAKQHFILKNINLFSYLIFLNYLFLLPFHYMNFLILLSFLSIH